MKLIQKSIFSLIILSTLYCVDEADAQSLNMNLLANRNQHPGNPRYSACWGYRAPNGREYAILGCGAGTAFVEITDTANIIERAFKTGISNGWREIKVYSHYAYVVSEASGSGVQIFDLQYLPDSVHFVTTYTFSGYTHTHSISQSGPYIYLNGGNSTPGGPNIGGVTILDLTTNPESPVHRGSWGTQYVHDCRVRNDTIWACNIYYPTGGTGSIYVINATNKDALTDIASWVNLPNPFPHNCDLYSGRTYIYTTDETSSPPGVLKVWNISNLSNVLFVTSYHPDSVGSAIVHNVERFGNYLVVAYYTAGVRVFSIANPTSPTEVGFYDTYPSNNGAFYNGCWGVYTFPSGKIIASDMVTGLYVLRTTFSIVGTQNNNGNIPQEFSLKQNYPNPFNPSTTIRYSSPKASYVTIKVYDLLGRQVGILVDEYKSPGEYSVSYDGSRLASGIYLYRLEAEGFKQTKKMIIAK